MASALLTGLELYLRLEEATGTRFDAHGANHLTPNGSPANRAGKHGNAVDLSGSSQWLDVADNSSLSVADIDFTLAAWVQIDNKGAFRDPVFKGSTSAGSTVEYGFWYNSSADRFAFLVGNGSAFLERRFNSLGSPSVGTWYLLIGWHDAASDTVSAQGNNGTVDSTSWTTGVQNGTRKFAVGRGGELNGEYWDGGVDDVALWKRLLTADERTQLWNSGNGLEYPFN